MRTKNLTIPLGATRAVTLTLWEDLGLVKLNKMNILVGLEIAKGTRLSAMERCDTFMLVAGPIGVTLSKVYLREGGV